MRDATMPPDLTAQIRRLDQRIEGQEMQRQAARTASFFVPLMTGPALPSDPTIWPSGAGAAFTDQPTLTSIWFSDQCAAASLGLVRDAAAQKRQWRCDLASQRHCVDHHSDESAAP